MPDEDATELDALDDGGTELLDEDAMELDGLDDGVA